MHFTAMRTLNRDVRPSGLFNFKTRFSRSPLHSTFELRPRPLWKEPVRIIALNGLIILQHDDSGTLTECKLNSSRRGLLTRTLDHYRFSLPQTRKRFLPTPNSSSTGSMPKLSLLSMLRKRTL